MWCVVYPDELYHHGIKGQKWGIRRFQNPDGSLTAAGRKRYNVYEDGSYARKSGRTKRLEKSVTYARMDEDSVLRMPNVSDNSRAEALRGLRINREAQETRLAESRERDRRNTGNGKKIAVAVGATVAGLAAAGLYAKYHNEINAAVKKAGTIAVGRVATYDPTKVQEAGKKFVSDQFKRIGDALTKGIEGASQEVTRATLVGAAGIAVSKMAARKTAADTENGESFVRNVLNSVGNKGLDDFMDSLGRTPGSSNTNSSGNKGGTVGKDVSDKLGKPANRGTFTTDEMTRYNQIHQDNRVKNNAEAKATVKALKKNGYSIEQIEQYVRGL